MYNEMITKKELKKYLNTGATLDRNGDAVSLSGYQVSFFDGPQVPQNDLKAVLQAVNEFLKACPVGELVGLWVDGGAVYIEKSEHVARLSEAMKKGIRRGELSIFDWCCNRCIVTND